MMHFLTTEDDDSPSIEVYLSKGVKFGHRPTQVSERWQRGADIPDDCAVRVLPCTSTAATLTRPSQTQLIKNIYHI